MRYDWLLANCLVSSQKKVDEQEENIQRQEENDRLIIHMKTNWKQD
jgi:hypothetical protein